MDPLGNMESATYRRIRFIGEYVLSGDLGCWGFRELCKRRLRMHSLSSMGALKDGPGGRVSILGNPKDMKRGTLVAAIYHIHGSQLEDH
jgi:hypothetical protein